MLLTVFTPVYNRGELLRRAYDSLCRQTDTDFEWLVIDDGSTDNTADAIREIVGAHRGSFPIRVITTPNGGKHRAVNRAVAEARGEWFTILDSDDYLTPDAVATMRRRLDGVNPSEGIAGVVALRVHPDGTTVGTPFTLDSIDCHHADYRHGMGIAGDRAEVVSTDVMRRYPFPEFPGERFLREGPVWQSIGTDYKLRYTSDPIYVCDYQPDGLTAKVARLHDLNPMGAAWANASALKSKNLKVTEKIKLTAQWARWSKQIADKRYLTPLPAGARKWLAVAPAVNLLRSLLRRKA